MRSIVNCTLRRISALAVALCLFVCGAGAEDLASDLGGGLQAQLPSQEEQAALVDMETRT